MSVDAATVRRIAHLARIAVADDEVEHLRGEINAILAFVEQLSEVNVEGVEPMTSVTPMAMKKRHDVVTDGGDADAVLRNAPATRRQLFRRAESGGISHVHGLRRDGASTTPTSTRSRRRSAGAAVAVRGDGDPAGR